MLRRSSACLLLALAAACSDGPAAHRGVLHLDPRLEGGGSSAEALAAVREDLAAWSFEAGLPAGWTQRQVPFEDRACRAWEWSPDEPLAADEATGLSFRAALARSTRARLSWRSAEDPEGAWLPERSLELSVPADPEAAAWVHLELAGHPAWSGDVTDLRLEPDGILGLAPGLAEARLVRQGFGGGLEPSGVAGDGGLVVLDGRARRTWPSDFGVPLLAEAEVPEGGRLVLDVALAAHLRTALEKVHLAVDVAAPGTPGLAAEGWERLWYRTLIPQRTPAETLWQGVTVDLGDHAGETVRLRLRAWSGHGKDDVGRGLDGQLGRAAVLWGAPELIGAPGSDPAPHILLVTLDTTRADALEPGGGLANAPFLTELAETGMRFSASYAASNATQPSHATILTGTWPTDHGVHDNYSVLVDGNRTLPERLRELGYHTVAAVSQRYLGAGCGFGQGFDEFHQAMPDASIDGGKTIQGLRGRLTQLIEQDPDRPLFVWLHLFDPHTPYRSPEGYVAQHAERFGAGPPAVAAPGSPDALPAIDVVPPEFAFLAGTSSLSHARHLYGMGVDYADALVENLASSLASAGALGRTAFFVTADHGESLGERSSYFNHQGLFPEVVRVPLVVRVPGGPAGVTIDEPVSGVDLAPTILRYAAGGRPYDDGDLRGRDLLAGLVTEDAGADASTERELFFEHAGERQAGVLSGRWYCVVTLMDDMTFGIELQTLPDGRRVPRELPVPAGTVQLFDVEADPGLTRDLAADEPERAEALRARIEAWRADTLDLVGDADTRRETTAAERDELEKLGY